MFKQYRLKRQLKKINELKLQEIKNQNFDLAAKHRDKEKEILQKLNALKKDGSFLRKLRLFFVYTHKSEFLSGIYLLEKDSYLPVYLPSYHFSRELMNNLECFFAEHPAFKFDWIEQPSKRRSMVKEITEYYFITEILDHFNRCGCIPEKDNCKYEITRKDLEAINHDNIFMKLFTLPYKHQRAFKKIEGDPDGKISVPKGYYHKFHYKFPYKLKLKIVGDNYVFLAPFMKLKFHVNCCEEERLPKDFCQFVGFDKAGAPRIDVSIDIYIKRSAFIIPRNWKHIRTMRSLKTRLKESFSAEYYFNTFN